MNNSEQHSYWNGEAGQHWAKQDAQMADLLRIVAESLLQHLQIPAGSKVLDIGCGGGSQSQLLAQQLGETGQVTGIDISEPLLNIARQRQPQPGSAPLKFIRADAQNYALPQGQFDWLFSRFGVMFFEDPGAAFQNLHRALKPGGKLGFCCWPSPKLNPFFTAPMAAILPHLPPQPETDPDAPGPFAFADPNRIEQILSQAGFVEIAISEQQIALQFGRDASLSELTATMARLGPAARLLKEQSEQVNAAARVSLEQALSRFYRDGSLHFPSYIWFVSASADLAWSA